MIQWYPGHMAKAIREIKENLRFVDLVLVLLDARIPFSSYNPLLKESLQQKKVLFILTKSDLANDVETSKWVKYYEDNKEAMLKAFELFCLCMAAGPCNNCAFFDGSLPEDP